MKPLKKEFSAQDIKRVRNLMSGREQERTTQGVGYSKKEEIHKEGDEWIQDGRTWVIKNGIKKNVTKLSKVKASIITPLFCPHCTKQMKNKFDSDFYSIHRKCYSCVIKFETQLKALGLYEDYEKNVINSNIDGIISDFTSYIYDKINESQNSYITENGVLEKWDGGVKEEDALKALQDTITYLKQLKK